MCVFSTEKCRRFSLDRQTIAFTTRPFQLYFLKKYSSSHGLFWLKADSLQITENCTFKNPVHFIKHRVLYAQ